MMTAQEVLVRHGHTSSGGRCDKCWSVAATMYAGGQGAYESYVEAYYAAMKRAEDDAEREAGVIR